MEGTPPPGSKPNPLTTTSEPKVTDNGGITKTTGENRIPRPTGPVPGKPGDGPVPLPTRKATPATVPTLLTPVEKKYIQQAEETQGLEAQAAFLGQIADLKEQLKAPESISESIPFFIYYTKGGTKYRVVPPSDYLKANPEELKAITAKLLTQLDTIDRHYQAPQVQALTARLQDSQNRLAACMAELTSQGIPIPVVNKIPVFTFSSLTAAATSGQPASPLPDDQPETNDGEFILVPKKKVPPPVKPKPKKTGPPPPPPPPLNNEDEEEHPVPIPVDLTFIQPDGAGLAKVQQTYLKAEPDSDFSSIFMKVGGRSPNGKIASVNAGHPDMTLGHNGINQRFKTELEVAGHNVSLFQDVHKDLIQRVKNNENHFVPLVNSSNKGSLSCAAIYNPTKKDEDSIIFDVFRPNHCPVGNPDNAAMIYMVPPDGRNGYSKDEQGARLFLADVKRKAKDLAIAQDMYNHWISSRNKTDIPKLNVLRTCMFGGDLPRHQNATEAQVASAIKAGFDEALATMRNPTIKEIQFEDGKKTHFADVRTQNQQNQ